MKSTWPDGTPRSQLNAFDLSESRPSIFFTPQGASRARALQKQADALTAKQREKKVTAFKPLSVQVPKESADFQKTERIRGTRR